MMLLWSLFARSACAQPATVVAVTKVEGAAVAFFSLGRRELSQPERWLARQVMARLFPLFDRSAWAQPAIILADTSDEGAAVASVRLVDVGSASHYGGDREGSGRFSGLCYLGRRVLNHPLCWLTAQLTALLWPLLSRSDKAKPATAVAGATDESAALASVRSVGVLPASHCGVGQVR